VRVTAIDRDALSIAKTWSGWAGRRIDWDWHQIQKRFQRYAARFEVAFWFDSHLCGLAIGKISDARDVVRVDYVEASPDRGHPLKGWIAQYTFEAAGVLADGYFSKYIRFQRPLEDVKPIYRALGMTFVPPRGDTPAYFELEVAYGSDLVPQPNA
jgi:hypothetical protein